MCSLVRRTVEGQGSYGPVRPVDLQAEQAARQVYSDQGLHLTVLQLVRRPAHACQPNAMHLVAFQVLHDAKSTSLANGGGSCNVGASCMVNELSTSGRALFAPFQMTRLLSNALGDLRL